jgi:hypothetical protein
VCTGDDPVTDVLRFFPMPVPAQEGLSYLLRWGLMLAGITLLVMAVRFQIKACCATSVRDARAADHLDSARKESLAAEAPTVASLPPSPPHREPIWEEQPAPAGRRAAACEALRHLMGGRNGQKSQRGHVLLVHVLLV